MPKAVSVSRMQVIDRTAIETMGIPRLLLMEHAGLAVARCARASHADPSVPIAVCCGTGFNGGDGLCAARHLHHWGYQPRVALAGTAERLEGEPAVYASILRRLGVRLVECGSANAPQTALGQIERWLAECGLIIDALLGIGIRGPVREPTASLITAINRSGKRVIAVDIPSGLDGDTGRLHGAAVKATTTVTFGLPKQGCLIGDGPAHVGSLVVDDITLPRELLEAPG